MGVNEGNIISPLWAQKLDNCLKSISDEPNHQWKVFR